jgi:cyclic pyranopterin phosphate synthase
MSELSHLDSDGRARMVDVGDKAVTARTATASGRFVTTAEVIALVKADGMPKADVLATARIAGIQGAKKTSELIPLCHPIPLTSVKVDFAFDGDAIVVTATAKTTGQTGVEMEALTAVSIAGLTLHDMVKAVDPAATMTDIRLDEKTGGKRGHWTRGNSPVVEPVETSPAAAVIVSSTSSAGGTREDTTGPVIAAWLQDHDFPATITVVPDADVATALAEALEARPTVIITTGGTGASPTDRTPEATRALIDREIPGIAEAIRAKGLEKTPTAALSRGLVGIADGTIIVNLPGSPGGVKDGLAVLDTVLAHLVEQVVGGGRHD